jgi:hypothetical protein
MTWLENIKNDFWDVKGKKEMQKANNREECASVTKKVKILRRLKSKGVRKYFIFTVFFIY